MAVKFAIEAAALNTNGREEAIVCALHQRLLDIWRKHGVLVIPDDTEKFRKTIEDLPQSRKKAWQTALKSPAYFRSIASNKLQSFEETLEECGDLFGFKSSIDLAALEETRAAMHYLDDGEHSKYEVDKDFEVCRFDTIDQSKLFLKQREIWDRHIYTGAQRQQFWKERFSSLCFYAQGISIVDRYAGKSLVDSVYEGTRCGLSHFLELISHLNKPPRLRTLNLFFSNEDVNAGDLEKFLSAAIAKYGKHFASVHLHMAPGRAFAADGHDRFIRFDGLITNIGKGLSLFKGTVCTENYACALTLDLDGTFKKKVEGALREKSTHIVIV